MKIIDKNIAEQTRGIFRNPSTGSGQGPNEWRDIPPERGSKQVLTDEEILGLSELVVKIEQHYGFPVDIEWARDTDGKFYIVQSRPITTLSKDENKKLEKSTAKTDFNGVSWKLTVTRNMSFWHHWNANYGLYHHTKDFGVNAKLEPLFITVNATKCSVFLYTDNFAQYTNTVMTAVDSVSKVNCLKTKYELFGKELIASTDKICENLSLQNWDTFIFNYRRYCAGLTITTVIGRAGSDILVEKLKAKSFSESDISRTIAKITFPAEYTPLFQSSLDLLKIGSNIQTSKISRNEIDNELNQWLEKYSHIPVNFCDEPWKMFDAKAQLDSLLQKDCSREIAKSKKEKGVILDESKALLKKLDDESIATLAYAIAEGTYLNELRKNIFSRVSLKYRGIFSKIAEQCGSQNWRDCFYLTPEEMRGIIAGHTLSIRDVVAERKATGAYTTKDGEILFLPEDVVKRFHAYVTAQQGQEVTANDGDVREIKGFSANAGHVKGIARIILDSTDFSRLAHGEILVTTMTSVDFVPIMERASAFVTNEGGITSHASIVAREMNKPCVIGTKIATQVLRDGDLVEVDAEKGVVRVLEKSPRESGAESDTSTSEHMRVLNKLEHTDWHICWSGPYPLLEVSNASQGVYFSSMQELFGVSFTHYLVTYKNGTSFGQLPNDEYTRVGTHLAQRVMDPAFLSYWIETFISTSHEISKAITVSPEVFLRDFATSSKLHALYARYGAFSEATKIVFDFLPATSVEAKTRLEQARKTTESFYSDNSKAVGRMVDLLAHDTGYRRDALLMLTAEELAVYQRKHDALPAQEVLADRSKRAAAYFTNAGIQMLSASEVDVLEAAVVSAAPRDYVSGTTAYPGRVRGRCRVVLEPTDALFEHGDVLVTGMTDPGFMPLIARATAVVTDGGGMLSHAAITARELKKPCIIGTKIATQVLHNDDLVEVDAEKGVVRILERA